ncbi:MAG: hypothetical protein J7497_07435, partial [Chitinophagaceae bacterium]|nr:hypothetical protein [Chitinophagaceae bacterium]
MKVLIATIFYMCTLGQTVSRCQAQQVTAVDFSFRYINKNNTDTIKLSLKNNSITQTYFYSIFLHGHQDTAWIPLLSDINSLGMNEFTALKPLRQGAK